MEIQKLPENVIQQIAAGEVLERPANLVKELMENAIDADATWVQVKVSKDARSFVISDNGKGMSPKELPLSVERHATSKIKDAGDLWDLHTYGFRGEALACVSAVSKMQITSKKEKAKHASTVVSHFGEVNQVETAAGENGTTIQIEDLFENLPARLKFLKSESAELMQIKKIFKTFAFTYPEVHFQLFSDGDLIFDLAPQKKRVDRVANLLNLPQMYESHFEKEGFKVHAVFSSPSHVQRSASNIWLFVQNRWILDRSLNSAVMSAYTSLLMHGEYPYVTLWIDCDPQEVDVNVHPTKAQVKFREPSKVFRIVREAIKLELEKAPWRKTLSESHEETKAQAIGSTLQETMEFPKFEFEATQFATKDWEPTPESRKESVESLNSILQKYNEDTQQKNEPMNERQVEESFWGNLQVIGQSNLTYILAQSAKSLFLVDQHAAHERVAYEKLIQNWREGKTEVQDFLFPYQVEMNEVSLQKILSIKEDLEKLGFRFEKINETTLGVLSGPALVKDEAIGKTMKEMAENLLESEDSSQLEKKISHICATIACHSVVRAGQALSKEEMASLLKQMDEYPLSTFCPHGRPVYIEYEFKSLDKAFGRIVS